MKKNTASSELNSHVQSVGNVALQWNLAEIALEELIWLYLQVDTPTGRLVTRPLSAKAKTDILKNLIEIKEPNRIIIEHIKHALNCWKKCQENRNIIVHGSPHATSAEFDLQLKKHNRSKPLYDDVFELTTRQMETIGKNIRECEGYILALKVAISPILQYRELLQEAELNETAGPSSPEPNLALPEKLRPPFVVKPMLDFSQDGSPPSPRPSRGI